MSRFGVQLPPPAPLFLLCILARLFLPSQLLDVSTYQGWAFVISPCLMVSFTRVMDLLII